MTKMMLCLLLITGLLAGCMGSEGEDIDTRTATELSEPTPTETPIATATPPATSTPEPTAVTVQGQAEQILGLVATRPDNIDLFTSEYLEQPVYPEAYPDGSPMKPATGTPRSPATVRNDLKGFLQTALGADTFATEATLTLFDDDTITRRVPDPNLRAAFVLLNLTVAAPLIDAFLTSGVYSERLDWIETGLAFTESSKPGPDGRQRVGMSDRYRYEHFAVIAPNLVHSMLHHDETFSYPEDVVILAIATVSYLQLMLLQPDIAYQGTELTRFNNTFALALLNSHRAGRQEIEIILPSGASVLPDSPVDAPDFWTLIARSDSPSVLPDVARTILELMLTDGSALGQHFLFSRELVNLIDGNINQSALSAVDRIRLEVLLTMISTDEIAALLDLSREETLELFDLGPIEMILDAAR